MVATVDGMKWLMIAVAIAGCGTDPAPTLLPSDVHYRVLWHPWPTMGQCLEHEGDQAACEVPLALSLCASGQAAFHKNGAVEVGTYAMDDADTDQHWIATIVTRRSLVHFDVEIQTLWSDSIHWDVDDAPSPDCD